MGSPLLSGKILRFGRFELDPQTQQLRRAGALLRIQPQPFRVLYFLVFHAGQVVTREQLCHELWGNETYVDFEQGLNYCIRQIRMVLGDEAQTPRYIETIPRHGYRFIAVTDSADTISRPEVAPAPESLRRWLERIPRWAFAVSVPLLMLVLIPAAVMVHSSKRPSLSEKDSLLIADFSNSTGDPVFDGTLRRAVSIDLGQSPYLNIVADEKVRQALRLMNKSAVREIAVARPHR
jgi:eukaryotic-like serine/threonine-protein kinase